MKQRELLRRAVDAELVPRDLEARVRTGLGQGSTAQWGRLLSSIAMLVMVLGGMQFYAMQKTHTLQRVGLDDHLHCAIAGEYPHQTEKAVMVQDLGPYAPMLQPILDLSPGDPVVSAHRCTVSGRTYVHVILRRGTTLVSVILTRRRDKEAFPGTLATLVSHGNSAHLHEGEMGAYSVAGFEAGAYLGYVVSALPDQQNSELAGRVAPVIRRYTGA